MRRYRAHYDVTVMHVIMCKDQYRKSCLRLINACINIYILWQIFTGTIMRIQIQWTDVLLGGRGVRTQDHMLRQLPPVTVCTPSFRMLQNISMTS